MKIGLALSGGGIKSFAQIPIIKAMSEVGIELSSITGTSMGSAVAALVASGIAIDEIYELVLEIEAKLLKTKVFIKPSPKLLPFSKEKIKGGYVDGIILENILQEVLDSKGIKHISDVLIPIAIPAVDLKTGKIIVFVSHPHLFENTHNWEVISDITLAKAVRASCSFPMVIASLEYEDYLLADGGIKMNLPSLLNKAYKMDKIVGITMTQGSGFDEIDSVLATGNRIYDLMIESYDELMQEHIDLMINVPVGEVWVFELGKGQAVINEGEVVAKEFKEKLYAMKRKDNFLERIFNR